MRELPDPYILAFFLLTGLALLLLYGRLLAAIRASAACYRGTHSTMEMLGNNYLCDSARLVLLLLTPFYALTLTVAGVSNVGFVWTLAALLLLWLFRKLACRTMGWLTGHRSAFRALERTGYGLCVLAFLVSMLAALLGFLVPQTPRWVLWTWLGMVAGLLLVVYAWRGFSMIFDTRFSLFFWVLYLCTLEILPICVVVNRLINGN